MPMARHFEITKTVAQRETRVITAMMDDLRRTVEILDCDVATEEARARVFDNANPHYPILARHLAVRRDNLKQTVAALQQHLAMIDPAQAQAIASAA